MTYELVEGLSRSDVAFRVQHDDLESLFAEGARALMAIMMENPGAIHPTIDLDITCEDGAIDLLYHEWLSEIIYFKDARRLLLLPQSLDISPFGWGYRLTARCRGEEIDRERHCFRVDIKAVTLHGLSVTRNDGTWSATAVIDV